ncbi:protein tramtrack, beta isoform-like isoform X8 [Homarus americanus]|uniref:protein tramtrack, beta isoform-like isoform X8 n=1 Tax=Homarus americanus TaxID=6706 RepID=UPI001C47E7E8|nr:protein tramtrack, beta isoform-like isoform X8 [Homarus americanus]
MCGKMAEELLSLKWNNHQAHFVDILTFLREQEIFVDATLACGGKLYAAHKFVLSTCSDYFKQMFTKNPSKHPIVFMKDVTSRDLEALLDFMYNGEVNVPQSSLGSLIKTAEGLQIKGLAVPDDPPAPKRERDRERDKRESKTHLEHLSPPAKRPRPRERSPPHSSPSQPTVSHPLSSHTSTTPSVSRSRSPLPPVPSVGASQVAMPPVEATLDEDSRTSIQSGISGLSEQNSSTTPSLSSKQGSSQPQMNTGEVTSHTDQLPHSHTGEEPSPGPSGLHKPQSKEEPEFEIKQEDVVDLGEDDEGDWGVEGDGGGGDSSVGSENPPNFPEVMLPHTDGSMPPTGDPAMGTWQACHLDWLRDPAGGDSSRPFVCTYCQKAFKRKDHLLIHEKVHTGDKPFVCEVCGHRFAQKTHLRNHLTKHSEVRAHACLVCGKRFKRKDSLKIHEKIHHDETNTCAICGVVLESREGWRAHLSSHYQM